MMRYSNRTKVTNRSVISSWYGHEDTDISPFYDVNTCWRCMTSSRSHAYFSWSEGCNHVPAADEDNNGCIDDDEFWLRLYQRFHVQRNHNFILLTATNARFSFSVNNSNRTAEYRKY